MSGEHTFLDQIHRILWLGADHRRELIRVYVGLTSCSLLTLFIPNAPAQFAVATIGLALSFYALDLVKKHRAEYEQLRGVINRFSALHGLESEPIHKIIASFSSWYVWARGIFYVWFVVNSLLFFWASVLFRMFTARLR